MVMAKFYNALPLYLHRYVQATLVVCVVVSPSLGSVKKGDALRTPSASPLKAKTRDGAQNVFDMCLSTCTNHSDLEKLR